MRRRSFLAAGVTAAFAGCVQVPREAPPSSEELVRDALETRIGLTDLQGLRTVTVEEPSATVERTERIVQRPPAERRLEVIQSTDPAVPMGTVSVRSRTETWEFEPARGRVTNVQHPNRLVADRTRIVLESLLEAYDLEYGATDTVGDRTAHVLHATPPADEEVSPSISVLVGDTQYVLPLATEADADLEDATVTRTFWIDDEHRYPVKERNVVSVDDDLLHGITFAFDELAIDEGLDDDAFTYQPPDGVELVERGIEPVGIYDSLEEAGAVVPYDLPKPDVPEPYELDRVTVIERGEHTIATSWYVDPEFTERELYVAVEEEQRFNEDVLEEVDLDGHEAYVRDGSLESVFWTCGELSYEVTSPIDDEPILEVASSIGCPATRRRTFELPARSAWSSVASAGQLSSASSRSARSL